MRKVYIHLKKIINVVLVIVLISSCITVNTRKSFASMVDEAEVYYMGETVEGSLGRTEGQNYYKINIEERTRLNFTIKWFIEGLTSSGSEVRLYNSRGNCVIDDATFRRIDNYNVVYGCHELSYAKNLEKGVYYIKFEVGCSGPVNYSFRIDDEEIVTLSKGKISSIKAGKKKLTIKCSKVRNADGYIVKYSINENLKLAKTKKSSSANITLKKLKKKQKYYIKVRPYYIYEDGTYVYGKWSKTKSRRTKR